MASVPDTALAPPPHGPADPPESPEPPGDEFPRWPLWGPIVAVAVGAVAAVVLVGIVAQLLQVAGPKLDEDDPWLTSLSTFGLDVCIVAATVGVAALTMRPRLWHFGLRSAPLRQAIGVTLGAIGAFLAFELVYAAIFDPKNPQRIVEDLGADRSTALLVVGALVVIAVAPVAEEILFRGFIFRVLRVRMGFWAAALIDGVLFGLVHGSLVIVPVLAFLGVVLCWVYERTGSIFPCIAIHVLNNTLSYGATTEHGWAAAGAVGVAMLAACALVPGMLPRPAPAPA
jgi:membrane protease YdiL (CAAX protease family)